MENPFCKIHAQGSTWAESGLEGQLTLNLEFTVPGSGNHIVWVSAADSTGSSAWSEMAQQGEEEIVMELPGVLLIVAGQGGMLGGFGDAETD